MKRILPVLLLCFLILTGCSSNAEELLFKSFTETLENEDYAKLYQLLSEESKERITEEEFITKYENIYSGIKATNFQFEMGEIDDKNNMIPFTLTMDTVAGTLTLDNFSFPFVKENKELKILWSESLIFPSMKRGDKVRISTIQANRGSILDRNGEALASDGDLITVGIHPAVFEQENKEAKIAKISELLDISEETITKKLDANTNKEYFVPLVDLLPDANALVVLENLNLDGVIKQSKHGRIYKDSEAFGRLLGYIRPINEEELSEDSDGVYTAQSLIGRSGLEQVYETTLRGIDGCEIYIEREGEKVDTLISKEPQNGEDIKLSIDSNLQQIVYDSMNGQKGSSTAVDSTTGEVLALVSSPSYNSNWFTTYMTKSTQEHRESIGYEDEKNRFASLYSPGSTFKLITAATGLENGTLDPQEIKTINGATWQPDRSWGNYNIRRINNQTSVSLKEAIKYSDNIYFAMNALEMGSDTLIQGAENFTIGTDLNIGYPIKDSQISNSGSISGDILLADMGYGQGEIMVSTLNMALAYSSLANNGSIMTPHLVLSDDYQPTVLKDSIISEQNLSILQDDFQAVVNDADGTGHLAKIDGVQLAGKTGTAEIKSAQGQTGSENGWFVATDLGSSKLSVAMVVEDVQEGVGTLGVVKMVKNVFVDYLK